LRWLQPADELMLFI
jgi:hypothetical protein